MKTLTWLLCISLLYSAEEPGKKTPISMQKTSSVRQWTFFDVNKIRSTISNDGPYSDYRLTSSSGLTWPKYSFKTAIFTSGILIVGKHAPTGALRTAVQQYDSEFKPGPIIGTFNTSTNDVSVAMDPNESVFRIYKINKHDTALNNPDYAQWPGQFGAPYNDLNKNGQWDQGIDSPKLFGDQTLWCVYNDLDSVAHTMCGTTQPMGIEVHAMYYGFDHVGPLENTMFVQWKIINKSDAVYDSLFIGLFSDVDMGDANDDVDGYDSTLSLAYVLNGDNFDAGSNGYGSEPPSVGTVLLGGNPSIRPYAYPVYIKGALEFGDPPLGYPTYPISAFNYLRGLQKVTGNPNINPITGVPDRFAFTGDPTTNSGWTRIGSGISPADVRSLLSLGPISFAPGDTQEVNAAIVIAPGKDRLESFRHLRDAAGIIRTFYHPAAKTPQWSQTCTNKEDSVTIAIACNMHSTDFTQITVDIVNDPTTAPLKTVSLFDDGFHNDTEAHDGIFSNTVVLPASPLPVSINATLTDINGKSYIWRTVEEHIPLSTVSISEPAIYSDDLNHDGKVDPGENIRFGVDVYNPHAFPIGRMQLSVDHSAIDLDTIRAHDTTSNIYDAARYGRYLSITVPSNYTETTITKHILLQDSARNQWIDSVTFPVVQTDQRIAAASRLSGKAPVDFDIIITDRNAVKNNLYVLQGIDSGRYGWMGGFNYGLQLKDSTENRIVIPSFYFGFNSDTNSVNHLLQVTEGFKIKIKTLQSDPEIRFKYQFPPNDWWMKSVASYPEYGFRLSTVHIADIPNVAVKFGKRTGFTDINNNQTFDPGEAFTFDTTVAERSQKAYLYSTKFKFLGFIQVPFAAYDISVTPPRKLTVVLYRSDTTNTSLFTIFKNDVLYVMSDPYSDNGILYDPANGGTDLFPQLKSWDVLPFYYYFSLYSWSPPLNDTGNFIIEYTPPLSSRDAFVFNPMNIQIREITAPTEYRLYQNYPNPFNPTTTLRFSLPVSSFVSVEVYNVLGQKVKTLISESRDVGTFELLWDGTDDTNSSVASGMYFYRLEAEGTRIAKKMLMLK
ncbi:MAG: T9SS type A sorting domain-containing protein [Bacteroidota bacterium]